MEQLFRGQIKGCLVKRGGGFLPFKKGASNAGGVEPGPQKWESQEGGYVDHGFFQEFYLELPDVRVRLDTNIKAFNPNEFFNQTHLYVYKLV